MMLRDAEINTVINRKITMMKKYAEYFPAKGRLAPTPLLSFFNGEG